MSKIVFETKTLFFWRYTISMRALALRTLTEKLHRYSAVFGFFDHITSLELIIQLKNQVGTFYIIFTLIWKSISFVYLSRNVWKESAKPCFDTRHEKCIGLLHKTNHLGLETIKIQLVAEFASFQYEQSYVSLTCY